MPEPLTIFVSAAEASGDDRAANLLTALRARLGEVRFVGVGGPAMRQAGCELLADVTRHASMLGGPLLRMGYWVRTVRRLQDALRSLRPDLHVPVDSPAMNWHLAKAARGVGVPVFYYIAPQVWAWAPWRVKKIVRLTDRVGCILPFEQRYLRDRGAKASYVGHPLFDDLPPRPRPLPDLAEAWSEGTWNVALLAGSRRSEIRGHTPALLAAAQRIRRRWSGSRCRFVTQTNESADEIRRACPDGLPEGVEVLSGNVPEALAASHFAIAKSGTITLEAAYYGVPMVILYRTSRMLRFLQWALGRWAVRTPYFSLVNILAGRRIVPELVPWHGSRRQLEQIVLEVMDDLGYLFEARQALLDVVQPLKVPPPGSASDNAAALIAKMLRDRRAI